MALRVTSTPPSNARRHYISCHASEHLRRFERTAGMDTRWGDRGACQRRSEIGRVRAASEEGLCSEPSPNTELPSRRTRTRACPNSALGGRRSRVDPTSVLEGGRSRVNPTSAERAQPRVWDGARGISDLAQGYIAERQSLRRRRDINATEATRLSSAAMPRTKRCKHRGGRHPCTRIPR